MTKSKCGCQKFTYVQENQIIPDKPHSLVDTLLDCSIRPDIQIALHWTRSPGTILQIKESNEEWMAIWFNWQVLSFNLGWSETRNLLPLHSTMWASDGCKTYDRYAIWDWHTLQRITASSSSWFNDQIVPLESKAHAYNYIKWVSEFFKDPCQPEFLPFHSQVLKSYLQNSLTTHIITAERISSEVLVSKVSSRLITFECKCSNYIAFDF